MVPAGGRRHQLDVGPPLRLHGSHWAAGPKGGLTFGFCLGLGLFFQRFYDPLVVDGYPYDLAWYQGGSAMIECLLAGAVLGAILKE